MKPPRRAASRRPSRPRAPAPITTGAILGAADGLLQAIGESSRGADRVAADWFKANPKLDGKARGPIMARVETVLRRRAALDWWIDRFAPQTRPTPRLRLVAAHILAHGKPGEELLHALHDPSPVERKLIAGLKTRTLDHPHMPEAVRLGVPPWLLPRLKESLGAQFEREMQAQLQAAPTDLRVNTLKVDRDKAAAALEAERLHPRPTPLSPLGLRLSAATDIGRIKALAEGLVEVQDEGSQIAALLVDARPGLQVADLCAGAGGKALAMAAAMKNKGHLTALDVHDKRLTRARQRLKRAGAENAECRALDDAWLKRNRGRMDRVLVDAPCTGTGTWRRNADARWRLAEKDIEEMVALQADLLDRAATLVKPGGRLVYVTCSMLREENAGQAQAFLRSHGAFRLLPVPAVWPEAVGGAAPGGEPMLQLSPARHGTDGFFVAIFERTA